MKNSSSVRSFPIAGPHTGRSAQYRLEQAGPRAAIGEKSSVWLLAAGLLVLAVAGCRISNRPDQGPRGPHAPIEKPDAKPVNARRSPNIVLVIADDLSAGEVGCYGQQKIRTPRIDALAAQGTRLAHFDVASPVCAPSRAAMLTGLDSGHAPVRDNLEVGAEGQAPLGAETPTFVRDLELRGYATGLFGKWGLGGPGSGSEPLDCGFAEFTGYLCQRKAHDHYPESLWKDRAPLPLAGNPKDSADGATYAEDVIRDAATAFIAAHREKPFLLVYASPLPHLALQVPSADLAKYAGAFPETPYDGKKGYLPHPTPRAAYAAMITRLDTDVGVLVDAIKAAGIERDTIVVFTADNGATHDVGGVDTAFFESTGGLRGRKGSLFEGGLRVPFIAWGPGHIPAGKVFEEEAWMPDLRPTIDAWCRAGAPPTDGRSLGGWIVGLTPAPPPPPRAYWEFPDYGGQQAVSFHEGTHLWKAVRSEMKTLGTDAPVMLFDLATDPNESHDVAAGNPSVVAAALKRMAEGHAQSEDFPMPGIDVDVPGHEGRRAPKPAAPTPAPPPLTAPAAPAGRR